LAEAEHSTPQADPDQESAASPAKDHRNQKRDQADKQEERSGKDNLEFATKERDGLGFPVHATQRIKPTALDGGVQ
jgi:hypothetical protein